MWISVRKNKGVITYIPYIPILEIRKSRKRNSQMANEIFWFQIKRTPWMAQFMVQFFPALRDTRAFLLLNHLEIFSSISMEKFFYVYY